MRIAIALFGLSSLTAVVLAASCVIETGPGDGFGAGGPGGGSFSGYICEGPATPPSGGSCVNVSGDAGAPPDGGMSDGGGHHGWDGGHGSGSSGSSSGMTSSSSGSGSSSGMTSSSSGSGGSSGMASSSSGSSSSGAGGGSGSSSSGAGGGSGSSSSGGPEMSAMCNPLTNAGCSGTDVCMPDSTGTTYVCQPEGTPANIAACGDCSDPESSCGVGGICITLPEGNSLCVEMCCTDADCGEGGQCNTFAVEPSLPDGVGVCVLP